MELAILTAMKFAIVLGFSGYQWHATMRELKSARS